MLCEKCCKNENVYSFEAYEGYEIPAEYDFICVDCVEEYRMWKSLRIFCEITRWRRNLRSWKRVAI